MTDPTPPGFRDLLIDPMLNDDDKAFAASLERQVKRERTKNVLTSFAWRAAVVVVIGLAIVAAGYGLLYLDNLVRLAVAGNF